MRKLLSTTALVLVWLCALALPVSQLRTFATVTTCCCPDPSKCHCPDHDPHAGKGTGAQLRACHKSSDLTASAAAPALSAPAAIEVPRAITPERAFEFALPRPPHPAPSTARPDAPS